jgi:hypothetical protein
MAGENRAPDKKIGEVKHAEEQSTRQLRANRRLKHRNITGRIERGLIFLATFWRGWAD